ncbi:MAG: hypothetical protein ABL900_21170, partial [Burkholderiaceae bacterium]
MELILWRHADAHEATIGHQDTLGLTASNLLAGTTQPWAPAGCLFLVAVPVRYQHAEHHCVGCLGCCHPSRPR